MNIKLLPSVQKTSQPSQENPLGFAVTIVQKIKLPKKDSQKDSRVISLYQFF